MAESSDMVLASAQQSDAGFVLTDPADRLLLLLARLDWTPEQKHLAVELAAEIEDWESLLERAGTHFILPLANRHLRSLGSADLPDELFERLHERLRMVTVQMLNVSLTQRNFIEKVLAPSGVPFAVVKGKALAGRYYRSTVMRVCRDVDVLVRQGSIFSLVQSARAQGYTVWPDNNIPDQELQARIRFEPEISLASPEGVLIEVHKQLDKSGQIFKTRSLLAAREFTDVDGITVPVLSTAHHFVFACLHHCRHLWSHLHWLADLDAMQRSRNFDREQVRDFAASCGVLSTVDAALALHEKSAELAMTGRTGGDEHSGDFLSACVHHVQCGPTAEFELRKARPFSDFAFDWQAANHHIFGNSLRRRLWTFQPRMIDYQTLPLPYRLHWLYHLTRPLTGLYRRLRRVLTG